MKVMFVKLSIALFVSVFVTACASITRGTTQAFTITSEPSGAEIALSTGQNCQTPCTLKLKRRPGFTVIASLDGYKEVRTNVVSQIASGGSAGMAGNLILGGIIGAAIDGSNGSMNELKPNPLNIVFVKEGDNAAKEMAKETEMTAEEDNDPTDDQ